jgi:hypothetical protein
MWWHIPVIPVIAGSIKEENPSHNQPGQKARAYLQNKQSKKPGKIDTTQDSASKPFHREENTNNSLRTSGPHITALWQLCF